MVCDPHPNNLLPIHKHLYSVSVSSIVVMFFDINFTSLGSNFKVRHFRFLALF